MDLHDIINKYNIVFNDDEIKLESLIIKMYNSDELILQDYDLNNPIILNLIGLYYQQIKINHELMIKYLLMAINKDNSNAMYNLGNYYKNIKKDYELMKKYYLMSIDKDNSNAMTSLGYYYHDIEINDEYIKKYYLMAINKGNANAMYNFGVYYEPKKYICMHYNIK